MTATGYEDRVVLAVGSYGGKATVREIASRVGMTERLVLATLAELRRQGRIEHEKAGATDYAALPKHGGAA